MHIYEFLIHVNNPNDLPNEYGQLENSYNTKAIAYL